MSRGCEEEEKRGRERESQIESEREREREFSRACPFRAAPLLGGATCAASKQVEDREREGEREKKKKKEEREQPDNFAGARPASPKTWAEDTIQGGTPHPSVHSVSACFTSHPAHSRPNVFLFF